MQKVSQKTRAILGVVVAGLAVSTFSSAVNAAVSYGKLESFAQAQNGLASTNFVAATIDGTTIYNAFSGASTPGVTKATGIPGTPSVSTITTASAWTTAGLAASGPAGTLWSASASALQIAEVGTKHVWRINKSTGAPSIYVNTSVLGALNGGVGPSITASTVDNVSGESIIYSTTTAPKVYETTGSGTAAVVISNAQLVGLLGGTGQITGLGSWGNKIIFGGNANRNVYAYDKTNGTFSTLLLSSQITSLTGLASNNFSTTAGFFYAPNGYVYFYDSANSRDIIKFDPNFPASTLSIVISGTDLTAGPSGTNSVTQFTWAPTSNNIAWFNTSNTAPAAAGVYVVPEPASLGLLGAVSLGMLIRRRRQAN